MYIKIPSNAASKSKTSKTKRRSCDAVSGFLDSLRFSHSIFVTFYFVVELKHPLLVVEFYFNFCPSSVSEIRLASHLYCCMEKSH